MERKEETSWAVVGSKGWKVVDVAGSWRVPEEEVEGGEESEGRRLPVRVPQKDMVSRRLCGRWSGCGWWVLRQCCVRWMSYLIVEKCQKLLR